MTSPLRYITVPGATRVFEQFGVDYCCGGARALSDACQRANLSVAEIIAKLEAAESALVPGDKPRDWQAESPTSLAAHIIDTHHFFTKQELLRLEKLLNKVWSQHGENHPELQTLRQTFERLKQGLTPHMLKEEQVLFPYIARLEEAIGEHRAAPEPFFVTVHNPIRMMTMEHEAAGELLEEIRRITGGYTPPEDACISYRTLYQALQELEADLHQHIHLENNILFPRAVEIEGATEFALSIPEGKPNQHRCFGL
jgi:regulator of cell morphogenesis and NO signaling